MKRFIPDVKNNVCTVDENGMTPLMQCSDSQECFYMCDKLNGAEKNDRTKSEDRHNQIGRYDWR